MPYRFSMLFLLVLLEGYPSLRTCCFCVLVSLLGSRLGFSSPSPTFLRADIADVLGLGDTGELDVFDHTDPGGLDLNIGA